MNVLELSEQEIGRRDSLQELREMGINPYPADEYPTNAFSTDIKARFSDDEETPRQVCIAGRLMGRRVMGKASFAELQDSKGRIQVYISRDDLCPGENKDLYNKVFKRLLDIGDFIVVQRDRKSCHDAHVKELHVQLLDPCGRIDLSELQKLWRQRVLCLWGDKLLPGLMESSAYELRPVLLPVQKLRHLPRHTKGEQPSLNPK